MDQGEFPSEIKGVLHSCVHSLSAGRAMDMGGISGQKDLSNPVIINFAFVDSKRSQPDGFGCLDSCHTALVYYSLDFFQGWSGPGRIGEIRARIGDYSKTGL